jgi:mannose-6-phosphate isomerase
VSILDVKKVEPEDAFFLETGTVHAIGAGILIAEIQQTSDITYRLYDFDRKDDLGNKRELHIDIALEAINFEKGTVQKKYDRISNQPNVMVDCPYFTTNFIPLDGHLLCTKNGKSFTVLMCVHGSFTLECEGEKYYYQLGDTILIPAALKTYTIYGKASILEIYIS